MPVTSQHHKFGKRVRLEYKGQTIMGIVVGTDTCPIGTDLEGDYLWISPDEEYVEHCNPMPLSGWIYVNQDTTEVEFLD